MNDIWTWLVRVIGGVLPAHEYDVVLGDLREESRMLPLGVRSRWIAREALCIALRYHVECYRDADDRRRIVILAGLACGLLWSVPVATHQAMVAADAFVSTTMHAVMTIWQAPHVTSAIAAGLMIGRMPLVASHVDVSRWHVVAVAMVAVVALHGWVNGGIAAGFVWAATWLGDHGRHAVASENGDLTAPSS